MYKGWTNYETWLVNVHYAETIRKVIDRTKHHNVCNIESEVYNAVHDDVFRIYIPNKLMKELAKESLEVVNWTEITESHLANRRRKTVTKTTNLRPALSV